MRYAVDLKGNVIRTGYPDGYEERHLSPGEGIGLLREIKQQYDRNEGPGRDVAPFAEEGPAWAPAGGVSAAKPDSPKRPSLLQRLRMANR